MKELLLRNAQIEGACALVDLRIAAGRIVAIDDSDSTASERSAGIAGAGTGSGGALVSETLADRASDRPGEVIDARGGALLPGLHDHHIHLHALAAAQRSVVCGPPQVRNAEQLCAALHQAVYEARSSDGWIRGVAYHESVAGDLDRTRLDRISPTGVPVRIQHRSGALWMLNGAAIERLDLSRGDLATGARAIGAPFEQDASGNWTGRIYYGDAWLGERLERQAAPDLGPVSRELASCGVTGVTDATPGRGAAGLELLSQSIERGEVVQRVVAMADTGVQRRDEWGRMRAGEGRLSLGPVKIMLREPALPDFDDLVRSVAEAHEGGRPVAVHCVTRVELVMAVGAIREAGRIEGDRIEHASVAPPELIEMLAAAGLWVVTQPGFLFERGDVYARDVEPRDLPWLYRGRGFLDGGVGLAAGTDAPYGGLDPWLGIRAAVDRRTLSGLRMGEHEGLSPERAVSLFTSPLESPGQPGRRIKVGMCADLCLLDRPWQQAREILTRDCVALTWLAGEKVWQAGKLSQ